MSTSDPYTSLLGEPSDSPGVHAFLQQNGAKPPRLASGDVRTLVEAKDHGVDMTFTDEAFLTQEDTLAIGEGALILTGIVFHSGLLAGAAAFEGELPYGVQFTHSVDDVSAALGAPEWSNEGRQLYRWRVDAVWCFAEYDSDAGYMETFSIQVADA